MNSISQLSNIKSSMTSLAGFCQAAILAVFYSLLILVVGSVIGSACYFFSEREHSHGTWH